MGGSFLVLQGAQGTSAMMRPAGSGRSSPSAGHVGTCGMGFVDAGQTQGSPGGAQEAASTGAQRSAPASPCIPASLRPHVPSQPMSTGADESSSPYPILPGLERAQFPLKLLSKALQKKTNMVLICSIFYSVIKPAANSNQRHRELGGTLGCVGSPGASTAPKTRLPPTPHPQAELQLCAPSQPIPHHVLCARRQQGGRLCLRHLLGRGGLCHHTCLQPRGAEGLRL